MAYYAKIENGVVVQVIVADQAFVDAQPGTWVETKKDGSIRSKYAGIGDEFHEDLDAFVTKKMYPSWSLDPVSKEYKAPINKPSNGKDYEWDEVNGTWVEYQFGVTTDNQ